MVDILKAYQYDKPFHLYFNQITKQHRNWGARDRKTYRNACYAYLRLGHLTENKPVDEMVLYGLDVLEGKTILDNLNPVFPYTELLSPQVDTQAWLESHLFQKPVYLVMRKGFEDACKRELNNDNISFEVFDNNILKLPPESKADKLTEQGMAWVMDRASAAVADKVEVMPGQLLWDACSGAGGKSLYISQKFDEAFDLLCSDRRFSVIENLKSRFNLLNLKQPKTELADLNEPFHVPVSADILVLDVPCTGSGTWGRTPENLKMFSPDTLNFMTGLQRKIVSNALKNLKQNGYLYYMTCSVFKAENEENVNHFIVNNGLKHLDSGYLNFNYKQTDTLYFAKLQKIG